MSPTACVVINAYAEYVHVRAYTHTYAYVPYRQLIQALKPLTINAHYPHLTSKVIRESSTFHLGPKNVVINLLCHSRQRRNETCCNSGSSGSNHLGVIARRCLMQLLQRSSMACIWSRVNLSVASSTKHLLFTPTFRYLYRGTF